MSVTVNLISKQEGILKSFLNSYLERDSKLDNDVIEWVNVYNKPLDAIDMMTAVIDNSTKYSINLMLTIDAGLLIEVNENNINDLVKYMLYRFYKESNEEVD